MKKGRALGRVLFLAGLGAALGIGLGAGPAVPEARGAAALAAAPPDAALVGPVTRAEVEAAVPEWVGDEAAARPDPAAIHDLAAVPPGAEVTVLLGTWCGDSRRELSRLWRAFDALESGAAPGSAAGGAAGSAAGAPAGAVAGSLPFAVRYIAVDERKREPAAAVADLGLRYLPTIIVRRDGREVGRIVEVSPHGVETDLLALLSGKASGLLTASSKMAPRGVSQPRP
jgi:hypothetical protein